MGVLFADLKKEYESIESEIDISVKRVLRSGWFVLGQELEQFENEYSSYIGSRHGIGVNSGTDALFLSLLALGIGEGDEVITVSHTFISTVDAIMRCGARPVFIDIEPDTYCMDTAEIRARISSRTKAIVPVHIYGNPVDMEPVLDIANKHGLATLEDACQAHGAEYKGKIVGSIGTVGCFSFYPVKNLGGYGDAGMVVTDDKAVAEKIKMLRNCGQSVKYRHDAIGINSRLDELQAAILRVKLPYLDIWNSRRRAYAKLYSELLADAKVTLPVERRYAKHVYHQFVIRCKNRDEAIRQLAASNIQTIIHYPIPVHRQKGYIGLSQDVSLPVTEKICDEILSLPLHPWLEQEAIHEVSTKLSATAT